MKTARSWVEENILALREAEARLKRLEMAHRRNIREQPPRTRPIRRSQSIS